jgi:hypothetical protein
VLVSAIIITQAERNSWSELLSSQKANNDHSAMAIENQRECEQFGTESQALACHPWVLEKFRKGEINGTVSSFSPSASGFRTGIPRKDAGDLSDADSGSAITEDMPVLRADYTASQTSLSGVREVAQRCFP